MDCNLTRELTQIPIRRNPSLAICETALTWLYVVLRIAYNRLLLLLAISQRFKTRGVRLGLLVVAALLLCFPLYRILTFPRA